MNEVVAELRVLIAELKGDQKAAAVRMEERFEGVNHKLNNMRSEIQYVSTKIDKCVAKEVFETRIGPIEATQNTINKTAIIFVVSGGAVLAVMKHFGVI